MNVEYLERVAKLIDEHGWMTQAVLEGDGDPEYSYTVGLYRRNHPELVIAGLPPDVCHAILRPLASAVLDGEVITPGDRPKVFTDLPGRIRSIGTRKLNVARAFAGRPIQALQVWWPDQNGRFPNEPGVDPALVDIQDLGGPLELKFLRCEVCGADTACLMDTEPPIKCMDCEKKGKQL